MKIKYILDQTSGENIKNLDVLDLGCGGGLVSESLCRLGANVTAIDFVKNNIKTEINNRLIYCTRNTSSDTKHGRMMEHANEMKIVDMLKKYCIKNNLIFTMFNGQENGKTMSHIKQLELFNQARVVVGPHGSAMANTIYLNPQNNPKICEFTSGTEVQVHGGIFNKHYNALFGYLFDEIYECYVIPFTKNSTRDITSIDTLNLKKFLEEI